MAAHHFNTYIFLEEKYKNTVESMTQYHADLFKMGSEGSAAQRREYTRLYMRTLNTRLAPELEANQTTRLHDLQRLLTYVSPSLSIYICMYLCVCVYI